MTRRAFSPVKPRRIGTVEKCLTDLIAQAGGVKRVMVDLGLKESTVYGFTEQNPEVPMSFARVAALTRPAATAAAEYLSTLAGGVFLPVLPDTQPMASLAAADARAHGEAVATLVDALKDGKLTHEERWRCREKLYEELRALLALIAFVAKDDDPPA